MTKQKVQTRSLPPRPARTGLVLKLYLGARGLKLHLSPVLFVLLAALLWAGASAAMSWARVAGAGEQARIQELELEARKLETQNRQIRSALALKERERQQMIALAEARSQELWDEMQRRDDEMRALWKVVGEEPPRHAAAGPDHRRQTLPGSRGGRRHFHDVKLSYRELQTALTQGETTLANLAAAADDYRSEKDRQALLAALDATPSIYPVNGVLCSPFGYRMHPIYGYSRMHTGVDLRAPYGTPIRAGAAGRVVHSGDEAGYGLTVIVDHGNGLTTLYGHCSSLAVGLGAFVKKGQTIAYVGSTGVSTGPHLHYEVTDNGVQVDPEPYLARQEARASVANRY